MSLATRHEHYLKSDQPSLIELTRLATTIGLIEYDEWGHGQGDMMQIVSVDLELMGKHPLDGKNSLADLGIEARLRENEHALLLGPVATAGGLQAG